MDLSRVSSAVQLIRYTFTDYRTRHRGWQVLSGHDDEWSIHHSLSVAPLVRVSLSNATGHRRFEEYLGSIVVNSRVT